MYVQHTPAVRLLTDLICPRHLLTVLVSHNEASEFTEFGTLQRLGEEIRNHVISGTELDFHFSLLNSVDHKELLSRATGPNIRVPHPKECNSSGQKD